MIDKIERNVFGHFKYLPQLANHNVEDGGLILKINCGLGSSMFNIVCSTHLEKWAKEKQDIHFFHNGFKEKEAFSLWNILSPGSYADAHMASYRYGEEFIKQKIQSVINDFNNQPFAWWLGPSCDPDWLGSILKEVGFEKNNEEHAMFRDLADYTPKDPPSTNLQIEQVLNRKRLEHFIQVLEPYDHTARMFYENLDLAILDVQELLFVGYEQDLPVEIGVLFVDKDTAGIFSLLTREDKRGKGYGTHMMNHLMDTAKFRGAKNVVLSASNNSGYRIYERLGFKSVGEFECFEWTGNNCQS